jgi:hypothetical protein
MAITVFLEPSGPTFVVGVKWRSLRPRETVMIRIRTGLFGVTGLLLGLLPT